MDALADRDEGRQGIADDVQTQEAEQPLREAGQLERQRGHFLPRDEAGDQPGMSGPNTAAAAREGAAAVRLSKVRIRMERS